MQSIQFEKPENTDINFLPIKLSLSLKDRFPANFEGL